MDKRSTPRREINAAIACKRYISLNGEVSIDGNMKNCCPSGCYAELKEHVAAGTVLAIRMTGNPWNAYAGEGLRTMALAEVRWSKPMPVEGETCFGTGLRYLMSY